MADTEFTIEVQAEGIGTESTAAEILALDDAMTAADKVVTKFDSALERTGALLAEAGTAAERANGALDEARAKYQSLEKASIRAGKAVERAANKGKDTTKLQAAADAAAAAVREQAQAVDRAAAEATSAAAAQDKLAKAYKNLEKRADRAAEATRGTERSFGDLFGAAGALGGPLGGLAGQISGIGDGLRAGGGKASVILGVFALGNMFIFAAKAAVGLVAGLAAATAGLLAFAVAADEATSKRLGKAWKQAQKDAKGLFEGVKTERLVRPVRSLLKLLDKNTSAGKGLAKIFETLLNPIIGGLDKGEPLMKEFFKGMILGALRAIIVVLKLRNAIAKAIPKETREKIKDIVTELLSLGNAAKAGEKSFETLGSTVAVVGLGMLVLVGAVGALTAALLAVPASIGLAAVKVTKALEKMKEGGEGAGRELIEGISEGVTAAVGGLAGVVGNIGKAAGKAVRKILIKEGGKAGEGLIDGIVAAIVGGAGAVALAATNLGKAAGAALKAAIESKSPSRLAFRIMQAVPEGAVLALKGGTPAVRGASEEMGSAVGAGLESGRTQPASTLTAPSGGAGAGTSPTTVQLTLQDGAITINAPSGDAPSLAREVRRVLLAEVDRAALQSGAGELATGTT